MARKSILKRFLNMSVNPEDMTPEQRADKFSSGQFTATQTGAKGAAVKRAQGLNKLQMNSEVGNAISDTGSFEDYISGKPKKV